MRNFFKHFFNVLKSFFEGSKSDKSNILEIKETNINNKIDTIIAAVRTNNIVEEKSSETGIESVDINVDIINEPIPEDLVVDTEPVIEFDEPLISGLCQSIEYYRKYFPNLGELDPGVSTISYGHAEQTILKYFHEQFIIKYGRITNELGYGITYWIIKKAIEVDKISLKGALREAIHRTNDPLLCVAVLKDYCNRHEVTFERFIGITKDVLMSREKYYTPPQEQIGQIPMIESSEFSNDPEEQNDLDIQNYLYNAEILNVVRFLITIRVNDHAYTTQEYNSEREFHPGQNVVVIETDKNRFRILDF